MKVKQGREEEETVFRAVHNSLNVRSYEEFGTVRQEHRRKKTVHFSLFLKTIQ